MQINASPHVFLIDRLRLPSIKGTVKNRVEDFRVHEKGDIDSYIALEDLSSKFISVSDSDLLVEQKGSTADDENLINVEEYMLATNSLADIDLINEWIHRSEPIEDVKCKKILFDAPESKENRRLIYEYLKLRYAFIRTEKSSEGDGQQFIVTADTRLLPLVDAGLTLPDVVEIYRFLSQGPLTEAAGRGITVGKGLDRGCRTKVYKCMSKLCPLLDSKTLDDRKTGMKKQQLFWRRSVRERMQSQANRVEATATVAAVVSSANSTNTSGQERIPKLSIGSSNIHLLEPALSTMVTSASGDIKVSPDIELGKRSLSSLPSTVSSAVDSSISCAHSPCVEDRAAKRSRLSLPGSDSTTTTSTTNAASATIVNSTTATPPITIKIPRYIKFVLVKNNVEHSEAVRQMADILTKIGTVQAMSTSDACMDDVVNCPGKAGGLMSKNSYLHALSFSGTKDKRGITAQYCCLEVLPPWINKNNTITYTEPPTIGSLCKEHQGYILALEQAARSLLALNKGNSYLEMSQSRTDSNIPPYCESDSDALSGATEGLGIGNISYVHSGLQLGQHSGNRFNIVIRDVAMNANTETDDGDSLTTTTTTATTTATTAAAPISTTTNATNADNYECVVCTLSDRILPSLDTVTGFPNYFGTQRFGIAAAVSADDTNPSLSAGVNNVSTSTTALSTAATSSVDTTACIIDDNNEDASAQDELYKDSSGSCNEMPSGPRVGKFLIQSNYLAAAHSLLLGNSSYQYNDASNIVIERGKWTCCGCTAISTNSNKSSGIGNIALASKKSIAVLDAREMYALGGKPSAVYKALPSHMTKERWLLQGISRYCGDINQLADIALSRQCTCCNVLECVRPGKKQLTDVVNSDLTADTSNDTCNDDIGSMPSLQGDYQRAIEAIPYTSRTMWVHAYGSWLWNRVTDFRLFKCPLPSPEGDRLQRHQLLVGDLISTNDRTTARKGGSCRSGSGDSDRNIVCVTDTSTIDAPKSGVMGGISHVVLPLLGSNVVYPSGDTGRFYRQLLEEDGFTINDAYNSDGVWTSFSLKPTPGLPKGAYRNIIQFPVARSTVEWAEGDMHASGFSNASVSVSMHNSTATGVSAGGLMGHDHSCTTSGGGDKSQTDRKDDEASFLLPSSSCNTCFKCRRIFDINNTNSSSTDTIRKDCFTSILPAMRFQFSLPVGSYATVFLREALGCDDML